MIIRRLEIKRFRRFKQAVFDFKPGLVVVQGPNESGKTTLQKALVAALYQDPASRAAEIYGLKSWGEEELPFLEIEIDADSSKIKLTKDLENKKAVLQVENSKITDRKKVEKGVADISGLPDETTFISTACVRQNEMERLGESGRSLMKLLGEKLTGAGGRDADEVIKELDGELDELMRGKRGKPVKNPGRIKRTEDSRLELSNRIAELDRDAEKAAREREDLKNMAEESAALGEGISLNRGIVDKNRDLARIEKDIAQARAALEKLLESEKCHKDSLELSRRLEGYPGYDSLSNKAVRLKKAHTELKNLERDSEAIKLKKRTSILYASIPLILGAIGTLGGLALLMIGGSGAWKFLIPAFGTVFAGSLIILIRAWLKSSRGQKEAVERLAELGREEKDILSLFGRDGVEEALKAYENYTEVSAKASRLRQRVQDLSGAVNGDELGRLISDQSMNIRNMQEEIESLERYRIADPADLLQRERALETDEIRFKDIERKVAAVEISARERPEADPEKLISLKEELSDMDRELDYLLRRARIIETASEALAEARSRVVAGAGNILERNAGPVIERITSGRYSKIRINERDKELGIEVFSEDKGDWVEDRDLSDATREQVYLAGRIALVELLAAGKSPVILLDDPFAHFDDARLAKCMDILKELSEKYHLILFTPTERYGVNADQVINLNV